MARSRRGQRFERGQGLCCSSSEEKPRRRQNVISRSNQVIEIKHCRK
jgi:hypothetical protein